MNELKQQFIKQMKKKHPNIGRAKIIKEKRKEHALTQQEVADALNITRQTYIKIEQGTREPTFNELKPLARILGVRPMDIFYD